MAKNLRFCKYALFVLLLVIQKVNWNKNTNKIFEETEISEELKNQIASDKEKIIAYFQ